MSDETPDFRFVPTDHPDPPSVYRMVSGYGEANRINLFAFTEPVPSPWWRRLWSWVMRR